MGPAHYLYDHWLHPATMSTVWPLHVKSCKEEGGLFGRRRKGVSGVLGGGNGSKGKGERGG
jgi:hypothetical protein